MDSKDWKAQTFSYAWLRKQALNNRRLNSAIGFLKAVGVIPADVEVTRGNKNPVVGLPADNIRAGYLSEVAFDWDNDGEASPVDFMHMLSFEVFGTPERIGFEKLMESLVEASRVAAIRDLVEEEDILAA